MKLNEVKAEFKQLYRLGFRQYAALVQDGSLHKAQLTKRLDRLKAIAHVLAVIRQDEWDNLLNRPIPKRGSEGQQQTFL